MTGTMPLTFTGHNAGQSNIDFLFGLMVFMTAFLYVLTTVPGLFIPYQSNSVDLSSVSYRTSTLLAEDPGCFIGSNNMPQSQWEVPENLPFLARIGLASSKSSPNQLSIDKVRALDTQVPYETSRDKLGLKNTVSYDYNLTIERIGSLSQGTNRIVLSKGPVPVDGNVESIVRPVLIDEGKRLFIDGGNLSATGSNVEVSIKPPMVYRNGVIIRIFNSSGTILEPHFELSPGIYCPLTPVDEYVVYKNDQKLDNPYQYHVPVSPQDIVEVVIPGSTIEFYKNPSMQDESILLYTTCAHMPVGRIKYDASSPYYYGLLTKGRLTMKVWM